MQKNKRAKIKEMSSLELANKYCHRRDRRYLVELLTRGGDVEFDIAGKFLQSSSKSERMAGAAIIGELGMYNGLCPYADQSMPLLIQAMTRAKDIDEKCRILRAIGWQNSENSGNFLLQYADDPDSRIRYITAWGLAGRNRAELDALLKLTNDDDEDVADYAVYNLIDTNGVIYDELQKGLTALAANPNRWMRYQAIAALAARHAQNAKQLLLDAWKENTMDGDEVDYLRDAAQYLNISLPQATFPANR